ncbi:MAG: 30S ribosomal protein S4e [Candidatus Saliniplasma sp.]
MKRHSKRYQASTERWGIPTKEYFWAPKTKPGAHPDHRSAPIIVLIRDILKYADTSREANMIVANNKVLLDGDVVKDKNTPVGLMDVISIPDLDEHYRMLFDQHGKIRLSPVEDGFESWKLSKIEKKTAIKDGRWQLNLHDGRNITVEDPDKYNTKDVLKISIPDQKIIDVFEFDKGNMALITGGKHIGELGVISEREVVKGSQPNLIHFEDGITTIEEYVFVVGREKPDIKIPEVGIL